jgi:hypothetical protein
VLWEYNGHRLRAEHGCINSEHTAADIAVRLNGMVGWFGIGLFRVQPGGDSLDNPCISIVWTNSKAVADEVVKMCGKENTEVVDLTEALVDAV